MSHSNVYKSAGGPQVGKFTYNDDIKKFQAQKWANDIKKKEMETKRFKKAATLRKYAKLCKAEGIQSDRVRMGDRKEKSEGDADAPSKSKDTYRPFKRAEQEAVRLEQAKQEKDMLAQQRLKEKEEAIRRREEKRRTLSKTTKKGQPLLGNHIKSILSKLQNA